MYSISDKPANSLITAVSTKLNQIRLTHSDETDNETTDHTDNIDQRYIYFCLNNITIFDIKPKM